MRTPELHPLLKFLKPFLYFLVLAVVFSGCASHAPKHEAIILDGQTDLKDSAVDISYVLGHSHRRFVATSHPEGYLAQCYHDRQILKEGQIDQQHYTEFFSKASQFIASPHRIPAEQAPSLEDCRSPFKVTVRMGGESKVFQGCRNADEGALSHLVRDGEFLLLHSKSAAPTPPTK